MTPRLIHPLRRGSVGVAMVIVLVIVQLVIVRAVISGARDQDLTIRRLETSRAFYATEAGTNMAIREYVLNSDYDGDGAVGTISNDGNSANDPTILSAQVVVTRSVSGSLTTLTSKGRSGVARRNVTAVCRDYASSIIVYGEDSDSTPVYRRWNGTTWSAETAMPSISKKPRWAVARRSPNRNEVIAGFIDEDKDCNVMVFNGTSWGSLTEVVTDVGSDSDRPYYLAYEKSSGDGIVCYRKKSDKKVYYNTWNGTTWSAQGSTASITTDEIKFIRLASKIGSDEIVCCAMGKNKDLAGLVWNGSSFGNITTLEATTAYESEECFDVAYEKVSGRCMVVWARGGTLLPRYAIWNGTSWSAVSTVPDIGKEAHWIQLASDPVSNKIIMVALDDDKDVNVNVWSGSAWGTNQEFTTDAPDKAIRSIDVAFEPSGTRALVAYARNGQNSVYYRVYDGTNWGTEQTGSNIGAVPGFVELRAQDGQKILLGAIQTSGDDLYVANWNGSAFTDTQSLEDHVGGSHSREGFMFPGNEGRRLTSWAESAP